MHSTRLQHTTNDHKPKPRSNNQTTRSLVVSKSSCVTSNVVPIADHSKNSNSFSDSKHFVCSTCHKCVFNVNHDACITKLLKEVNSRAKIQSHKTKNSNKPVDQKSHTQKPSRQIFIGHRFSLNKTFAMFEKTSPRSDLRWTPTGRILKSVSLRWIPTGKLFDSCTGKVDSEPPHGSNGDIFKIHVCKQTLDLSAGSKPKLSQARPKKKPMRLKITPSPSNLKQMKSLSGKHGALNRFLSKAVERVIPCLDKLKKCTNKKDFRWTEEAFQTMKRLIAELPILTASMKNEELMVYLSAAKEVNYAPMEKLALALVHAARRLRRYFQGHAIKVVMEKPINQILNSLETSGRLAKWAVELGSYGISYAPRKAIKALDLKEDPELSKGKEEKAKSDPMAEVDTWKLYTNGASNDYGSGAGLILIDLECVEYSYALRLSFNNSNNDAEYESLLAGLRIVTRMKVKNIHAFVDSKLVVSQVEGSYEARGKRKRNIRKKVLDVVRCFDKFQISHIPREQNKKVDALRKLAAVQCEGLTNGVLVEKLNELSVNVAEVNMVVEEEGRTWMTTIREYIERGTLSDNLIEERTIREKINNYVIKDEVLYRKSYLGPLLRCIGPPQANYAIREIHMGSCGMHDGPRRVVHKAINAGYYWPSMHRDANNEIKSCDACQAYEVVPRLPKDDMILVTSAWHFRKKLGNKAHLHVRIPPPSKRGGGTGKLEHNARNYDKAEPKPPRRKARDRDNKRVYAEAASGEVLQYDGYIISSLGYESSSLGKKKYQRERIPKNSYQSGKGHMRLLNHTGQEPTNLGPWTGKRYQELGIQAISGSITCNRNK
ncbi:reverse transcriptase domain-containing protein [Tanacetum coccineum]